LFAQEEGNIRWSIPLKEDLIPVCAPATTQATAQEFGEVKHIHRAETGQLPKTRNDDDGLASAMLGFAA
jgi:hypothetical protein